MREYAIEHNMKYLLEEWNEEKNEDLTPDIVSYGSNKKVHWKKHYYDMELDKEFDFEWETTIKNRTIDHKNCPFLVGKAVFIGFNDLNTRNPNLAKELNYEKNIDLNPENFTVSSSKKVFWRCKKCGYSWKVSIDSRNCGNGCPECAKEIKTSFPEYAILYYFQKYKKNVKHSYHDLGFELDIYIPDLKIAVEYDGGYWHKDTIEKDLEKNKKCKELGIKLYRIRENICSLNDSSIDILCTTSHKSLNQVITDLIKEIFNVEENINVDRDKQKIEKVRIFRKKVKSLAENRPDLISQWHPTKNLPLTPETVSLNSHVIVTWIFSYTDSELGHFDFEWTAKVSERTFKNNGCPFLSGKRIWIGFNDFKTRFEDIAELWDYEKNNGLDPTQVAYQSNKSVYWKCPYCKKSFQCKISYMSKRHKHCPHCNKKVFDDI